jgi:undecaprenyl-diphosphatase
MAVLLTHAIYPLIKGATARLRPFEIDPTLQVRTRALDRYSFTSGHCMTASAVFLPLAVTFPQCVPVLVALFLVLAWAQLACALHYPTDLFCGTIMGAGVAGTVCECILQLI